MTDIADRFAGFLGLGESDRQRTRAVLGDAAHLWKVSEREALKRLWVLACEAYIQGHQEAGLGDDVEQALGRTGGGQSILRAIDKAGG